MVAGDQKGRRKVFKIRLAQGLGIFMTAALIDIAVVNCVFGRKPRRVGLCEIGAFGQVSAKAGIDQDLAFDFGAVLIARLEAQGRSKVSARAQSTWSGAEIFAHS